MGNGTDVDSGANALAPADFIALSESSDPILGSETTLPGGELADGFERAQATYGYTVGAGYTLTRSFTKTGGTPVTVRMVGVFNESVSGIMAFLDDVSPATLESGDTIQITYTVTI